MLKTAISGLLFSTMALAWQAPHFEVASVKPSVFDPPRAGVSGRSGGGEGGCPQSLKSDPSQIRIRCATLAMLIGYAYRFSPDRVQGPAWMDSPRTQRFDIAAKIPEGVPEQQSPRMMQSLLEDRFGLAIHASEAIKEVFALVLAKGGLKMAEVQQDAVEPPAVEPDTSQGFYGAIAVHESAGTVSSPRMGAVSHTNGPDWLQRYESPGITLAGLAELLDMAIPVQVPILDMTGNKGRYRLDLELPLAVLKPNPDRQPGEVEDLALHAFNEGLWKLGLQLERRKVPVPILVVDRVERMPTQN
jgi:uncharacterized protein (TIGR03435 family)